MGGKILLVGPRVATDAPTGVAVAFETLIDTLRRANIPTSVVNTQWGGKVIDSGAFSPFRAVVVLGAIASSWWHSIFSTKVYLPLATSRLGFLRDALIILFASMCSKPVFGHLHGSGYSDFYRSSSSFGQAIIRYVMARVDCFVVLSENLKNQFDFLPDAETKTVVVANGADFPELAPDTNHKTKPANEKWQFLYLSNLMATKGYFELLQATKLLAEAGYDNFHVNFCGAFVMSSVERQLVETPDERQAEFLSLIESRELQPYVSYHGVVGGHQKSELLRSAHFLVLPTYYPWEGQPISIIEGLCFGTPVIATRHKGIVEQIDHEENGFFVEKRSVESLASCLRRILDGVNFNYEKMSETARRKYLTCFTLEAHGERMLEVLQSVSVTK